MKTLVLLTLICAGTVLTAEDVQYNYDRDINFTAYKTYQWADGGIRPDQLIDRDIRRAVENELAKQGLQKVEAYADIYLRYQTAIDREKQWDGWTMGPRWSGMARATSSTVEVGTLVIKMYDPAKKQLVWQGSVSKTLDIKKDPDKNYRNLEKAVAKLLRNYPPKTKS